MGTDERSPVVGTGKPRPLNLLGPGLICGAADDEPTATATYAQAGAPPTGSASAG